MLQLMVEEFEGSKIRGPSESSTPKLYKPLVIVFNLSAVCL